MIQRIQSLWFLLASACSFLSLTMPFYVGTSKEGIPSYQVTGMENLPIMMLTIATGALAFIIIFLYKKRKRQVRFAVLGIMLELLLILMYYLKVSLFTDGAYTLTSLLQGCVLFFLFLALRGIGKDIKVIKESDRLR